MARDPKERERLLASPVRLQIMATLVASRSMDFPSLKERLGLTGGNLSSHIKQLERAEYLKISKDFVNNRPKTEYTVTDTGREEFAAYIDLLESIISLSEKGASHDA
ncbi:MAG: winged helix-turn-helix domain-containing protein [Fibrobacterota bacterium]